MLFGVGVAKYIFGKTKNSSFCGTLCGTFCATFCNSSVPYCPKTGKNIKIKALYLLKKIGGNLDTFHEAERSNASQWVIGPRRGPHPSSNLNNLNT